jgi:hypothetical protein
MRYNGYKRNTTEIAVRNKVEFISLTTLKHYLRPGMVAYTCNSSTWEAEVGGSRV